MRGPPDCQRLGPTRVEAPLHPPSRHRTNAALSGEDARLGEAETLLAIAGTLAGGLDFTEALRQTCRHLAQGGQAIASCCVGFGLERLVYAFLCQHGLDDSRWPASVRREIG